MKFELVVLDIEGCIRPSDRSTVDLGALKSLQEYCERINQGEKPPVILLTGRPAPYCEAVIQDIGAFGPGFDISSIAENGAVYWNHNRKKVSGLNPAVEQNRGASRKARKIVESIKQEGGCVVEPGKEYCISLNPVDETVEDLFERVRKRFEDEEILNDLDVTHSSTAVDINPASVNKRSGLEHLLEKQGIDPANVLGVGDSNGDKEWLELVGQPATPANGADGIKGIQDVYVSEKEEAEGLVEILDELVG